MKLILLLCGFAVSFSVFAKTSIHYPDINLEDFFMVEGTYQIQVARHDKKLTALDLFVLMFDAKKNTLVASLTSQSSSLPLVLFEDLKPRYLNDRKTLEFTGYGGGVLYGELRVQIDIQSGHISGIFEDGIPNGRMTLAGKQKSSLLNFILTGQAYGMVKSPFFPIIDNVTGLYKGREWNSKSCAGKPCEVEFYIHKFSDHVLSAELTLSKVKFRYIGGDYDQDFGLLEFTSLGAAANAKLRTKVNVRVSSENQLQLYLYTTSGNYTYFNLKKTAPQERRL